MTIEPRMATRGCRESVPLARFISRPFRGGARPAGRTHVGRVRSGCRDVTRNGNAPGEVKLASSATRTTRDRWLRALPQDNAPYGREACHKSWENDPSVRRGSGEVDAHSLA